MEPTDPKLAPFLARVVRAQTLAYASWEPHVKCALRPKSASAISIERPAVVEQALTRACVILELTLVGGLEGPLLLLLAPDLVERVLAQAAGLPVEEPGERAPTKLDDEQIEAFRGLSETLTAAMSRCYAGVHPELRISEEPGDRRAALHEPHDHEAFTVLPDEPVALARMAVQVDGESFSTALALPRSLALAIADLPDAQAA